MTIPHPKRRVFYSFHYEADVWRAAQVRNIGATEGNEPVSDNNWEQIKRGGDAAIQNWINSQIAPRSCVIVLIGTNTAGRRWIDYEIAQAWNQNKALLGIHIHQLENQYGQPSWKGFDPFDQIRLQNGTPISKYVTTYHPDVYASNSKEAYAHIRANLANWVEIAIQQKEYRPR